PRTLRACRAPGWLVWRATDVEETSTMVDFKALVPWRSKAQTPAPRDDYFDPFVTFRREMDRMFDDFLGGSRANSGSWPTLTPAVGIDETEKELVITAELPG